AAREHIRKNAEARHNRRMKVGPSDPSRDADADKEADNGADYAQSCRFGREESVDQMFGSAQRLHDGKVTTAVEDPSDERGEHAKSGSEHNQRGGSIERSARFVQHVRF